MSRQTEDGNHEGYVVHVFADGMYGSSWSGGPIATTAPDGTDLDVHDWQARTKDEIVGWRAHCNGPYGRECWRGHLWTRVTTAVEQDPTQRRIYHPGGDLDYGDDGYGLIDAEWDHHIAPFQAIRPVELAFADVAKAEQRLYDAVWEARNDGASWQAIGAATEMTGQAAEKRWWLTAVRGQRDDEPPVRQ